MARPMQIQMHIRMRIQKQMRIQMHLGRLIGARSSPGHQQDVVHGLGTASQMPKSMNVALERATHAPAAAIPLFFGTNLLQTLEAAAQTTVS